MIGTIVTKINEAIANKIASYPCLDGAVLYGLAEPILRKHQDIEEYFPVIVCPDNEDTLVFVDDDFPMGLYHRLLSKAYTKQPLRQDYGDQSTEFAEAEMLLICWAFRDKVNTDADTLERLIYSSFRNAIKVVSSNFKRTEVFSGEFTGVPFFLPEDVMLFSMKYRFKYPAQQRECIEIPNFCK